jgi:hypothetical protein
MADELRTKSYPENYPSDAMAILDAMSFSGGKDVKVLGSMSLRSQQYAGDYDAFEIVKRKGNEAKVLDDLASEFQTIIKNLRGMKNVFIGDIKAGSIEEWRVISLDAGLVDGKIVGYNPIQSKAKIDELYKAKVITEGEKRSADELLKDKSSPEDFLIARKKLKFHIVRWSVPEVLNGSKVVRGRRITLQEAFSSPVITKLDTIGFVQNNKYTDFSIIYEFHNGEKVLNPSFEDIGRSLSEDIIFYKAENNPFKVLKREFALAKFRGDEKTIKGLTPVLNSDLGRLYSLLSDVGTLIQLLDDKHNVPLDRVRYEIDQFKARMASVYSLPDFLKTEHTLLGHIASAMKTTSREQLLGHLIQIEQLIQTSLTHNTKKLRGGTHRTDFLKDHKLEDKGYSLEELSKISKVPLATLQEVYNRGIGAYKTNPQSVRMKGSFKKGVNAPMSMKLSKEMWALARVYSFLDGNPKHDNDLRLKGGAEIDIENLPPFSTTRDAAAKTAIANRLASQLKDAAHYYAYREPAVSLGYRTIADELYKKAPTLQGQAERALDVGHEGQTKKQMARVVWGDRIPNKPAGTKTENFYTMYSRDVAPHFAAVKTANPAMTHNAIQKRLEENI